MIRIIALFGSVAGLIVTAPMLWTWLRLSADAAHPPGGLMLGYLTMVVALSAVFVGIKRHRDQALGGVIRFLPALGLGLGISFVASLFYVIGWEIVTAYGKFDFMGWYYDAIIEGARGQGAEAIQKATVDADDFKRLYANPPMRMAFTFIEIFPVGVLISLVSAAVLRNPRVLPARAR